MSPDGWAAVVYPGPYDATVTQVEGGVPMSSLSCEAIVADMLDSLLLDPGHRVLELGTGAGRNAALVAARTGPGLVTSVEVGEGLAELARERIKAARADVAVVVADGAKGWPAGAPYDRVISTYAVERIPWAWVEQTRPGGRIVTPWGRLGHVALTVAEDGRSATGWVQGLAQFMPSRETGGPVRDFQEVRSETSAAHEHLFDRDLALLAGGHLLFALRVALPDVMVTTVRDADGLNAWLHDGDASWATLCSQGDGRTVAFQGGSRRLVDEVERVWDLWVAAGSPSLYDFRMTVEPGCQTVWCRDRSAASWWAADDGAGAH
ncbi:methyltransferase domain-containing protein [Streptomyces sp. NPDC093108]|uniref:methyltransferase domain-containing protein n=1 Tax=Streptomyces sp. NPDC093108 TaxID=3366030 RepID=UPI00380F7AD3